MIPILGHSRLQYINRRPDYHGYEVKVIIGDRDIYDGRTLEELIKSCIKEAQNNMDYYKLPKDDRWMPDNWTPDEIGGHYTDIGTIAFCLTDRVKTIFPINAVPKDLAALLIDLETRCRECEECIQETIGLISDYKMKEVSARDNAKTTTQESPNN